METRGRGHGRGLSGFAAWVEGSGRWLAAEGGLVFQAEDLKAREVAVGLVGSREEAAAASCAMSFWLEEADFARDLADFRPCFCHPRGESMVIFLREVRA